MSGSVPPHNQELQSAVCSGSHRRPSSEGYNLPQAAVAVYQTDLWELLQEVVPSSDLDRADVRNRGRFSCQWHPTMSSLTLSGLFLALNSAKFLYNPI